MIDIFEKNSLQYVKKRIVTMTIGETRRGRGTIYLEAADDVFEQLFGVRRYASRIADTRTISEMRALLKKVDYEALFEILRMSESYKRLAQLVLLKYDMEKGEVDKDYKKTYKRAIARFIDEYGIRTNAGEMKYADLKDYALGRRDYDDDYAFDAIYDDDDYKSFRKKSNRTFSDLMDDDDIFDDDRRDYRQNSRRDENYDDFADYMNRKSESRDNRNRNDDDTSDIRKDTSNDRIDALADTIESLAKVVEKSVTTPAPVQTAIPVQQPVMQQPAPLPTARKAPPTNINAYPSKDTQLILNSIGVFKQDVGEFKQTVNNSIENLHDSIEGLSDDVDSLKRGTSDLMNEAFDRIDTLAGAVGVSFDDDDSDESTAEVPETTTNLKVAQPEAGIFVRQSNQRENVEREVAEIFEDAAKRGHPTQ